MRLRRFLLLAGGAVVLLATVVVVRTIGYSSRPLPVEPATQVEVPGGAAERLAGSLRIQTISRDDGSTLDADAFRDLHHYLGTSFPLVHARLERETVGTHSLLYTWRGSDPSLKAILLAGHLDVVPVESGAETAWKEAPFGGRTADGFVWGRGAIDNKSAVVGMLEAVEMLLAEGFRPARSLYLAYGHDEEVGGVSGAREIAAVLESRGVALEMVLDEGGIIGEGIFPGLSKPVALVGIAEKGFVSVELSARTTGGHSSLPPPQSAIGILSAAIARLEACPMPARLEGPTRLLFDRVGPNLPLARRALFANLWLSHPLVIRALARSPGTNAMVRTTAAATVFQAGAKDNVLPRHGRAVVNFRILPGDNVAGVMEHVRHVIDDPRVEIRPAGALTAEPSSASSIESESFRRLERAIGAVHSDAIIAPCLVVVMTDARHYADLSRNVFRFLPLRLTARDLERIHGTDERLAISHYEDAIRTYRRLILDLAGS